jgi:polyisoprenyl-phosphate glycosyltransferase
MIYGIDVPGYASMMVGILFLGGLQLLSLGMIGEYLARVFTEVKARPIYVIAERVGFNSQN